MDGILKSKTKSVNKLNHKSLDMDHVITRCRSAPAHRILTLPDDERGVTTSAFNFYQFPVNKMNIQSNKSPIIRPKTASTMANPLNQFLDLKIKTFHFQLEHEEQLKKT